MKVHDYPDFPDPTRVRIALAEKGLGAGVELVQVDVPGGEHRTPAFLAKNPFGAVPVLELDDGTMIAGCTAITEHLDALDGDPALTGRNGAVRARIGMMQRGAESNLLDAVAGYLHHVTPALGPDLETDQDAFWGRAQRERARFTMAYLDGVLAAQDYPACARFTVADITALPGLLFADAAGVEAPVAHENLAVWRERVSARESVRATLG